MRSFLRPRDRQEPPIPMMTPVPPIQAATDTPMVGLQLALAEAPQGPSRGTKRPAEAPAEVEAAVEKQTDECQAWCGPSVGNGEPATPPPPTWMGAALKWWRRSPR